MALMMHAYALILLLVGGGGGGGGRSASAFVPPNNFNDAPSWLLPPFLRKLRPDATEAPPAKQNNKGKVGQRNEPPDTAKSPLPTCPVRATQEQVEASARARHDNDAMNALLDPVPEKPDPQPCSFASTAEMTELYGPKCQCKPCLPADFPPGALLRIGPNGASKTDGFLDGDGMVLCITIPPGAISKREDGRSSGNSGGVERRNQITSSQTYIDTTGRKLERIRRIAGPPNSAKTFGGSLGSAPRGLPILQNLAVNALAFQTLTVLKDTCNTALAEHGGRVLALMEQCPPAEIEVCADGRVKTVGSMARLDGAVPSKDVTTGGALGAHGRTCPDTGRRFHVTYRASSRPYVRVDVFDLADGDNDGDGEDSGAVALNKRRAAEEEEVPPPPPPPPGSASKGRGGKGWSLRRTMGVDVPTPVMMHDFALTSNYVVLFDLPLTVRPTRLLSDRFPVEYEPNHGARIGLLRWRDEEGEDSDDSDNDSSDNDNVQWFNVEPGVVLHAVNSHESTADGTNRVVVHALRSQPDTTSSYILRYTPAFLHEWVLDLDAGTVVERCLNPGTMVDFPVVDGRYVSREMRHGYAVSVKSIGGPVYNHRTPEEVALLDGMAKFALVDDDDEGDETRTRKGDVVEKFTLPPGWYGVSEPTIVPKVSFDGSDDEGAYALLIATNVPRSAAALDAREDDAGCRIMRSQLLVLDVCDLRWPIAAIDLPHHVPNGLHSMFLGWEKILAEDEEKSKAGEAKGDWCLIENC